jgi:hypothetical protein
MPRYADSINEYCLNLIDERYKALGNGGDDKEEKKRLKDIASSWDATVLESYIVDTLENYENVSKYLQSAILGSIDYDQLQKDLHDWLNDLDDEYDEDEEEAKADEKRYRLSSTIVSNITCTKCGNTLPPMTMQDHIDGNFNQECPHTATVAMKECVWCVYPDKVPMSELTYIIDKDSADKDEGLACKTCTERIEISNMKYAVCSKIESTPMSKEHMKEWLSGFSS